MRASAGTNSEDVKGPHAALAVRLQQRDPGRSFVLGERLQYVLLPGFRTQARSLARCLVSCVMRLHRDSSKTGSLVNIGYAPQEEASEEPKTAAKIGAHANYELYFRNKLCAPLSEIFQTCLSPAQVQVCSRPRPAACSQTCARRACLVHVADSMMCCCIRSRF